MAYIYKREPLLNDEANRLANACETRGEKLIIWTLLDTGLRVAELAGLKPQDVDWQRHTLMINGKGGPFGKRTKKRVVPMTPRVAALLEGHFAQQENIGMSTRTIERMVKRAANRARIAKFACPHVLRHTFACTAIQRGLSLPSVQYLLGHDHLETTAIYLHLTPEHVIEEFNRKILRGGAGA